MIRRLSALHIFQYLIIMSIRANAQGDTGKYLTLLYPDIISFSINSWQPCKKELELMRIHLNILFTALKLNI